MDVCIFRSSNFRTRIFSWELKICKKRFWNFNIRLENLASHFASEFRIVFNSCILRRRSIYLISSTYIQDVCQNRTQFQLLAWLTLFFLIHHNINRTNSTSSATNASFVYIATNFWCCIFVTPPALGESFVLWVQIRLQQLAVEMCKFVRIKSPQLPLNCATQSL